MSKRKKYGEESKREAIQLQAGSGKTKSIMGE